MNLGKKATEKKAMKKKQKEKKVNEIEARGKRRKLKKGIGIGI